jgi:rRNA maturation endonuclease Nob1
MPCGFQAGKGDCGIWKCVRYGKHVIIKYQTAKEFEFCPFCGSKVGENMYIRFGFG